MDFSSNEKANAITIDDNPMSAIISNWNWSGTEKPDKSFVWVVA